VFVPYFVNLDVGIEIDRAVVDEFNERQEAYEGDGKECH
jgi:hypothetical protein